jgi:signal peptidase I
VDDSPTSQPSLTRPDPASPPLPGGPQRPSAVRSAVEWVAIIVGALVVALLVKATLLQAFYIPSESMDPTLKIGDRVLVNKLSYRLHDMHRGDIIVFLRPQIGSDTEIKDLIKRVVALPGETVESDEQGRVHIDGRVLDEPYLPPGTTTTNLPRQVVPPDHYWVMGDNRNNSRDSRVFGAIGKKLVVGRAFVRVWPFSALSLL